MPKKKTKRGVCSGVANDKDNGEKKGSSSGKMILDANCSTITLSSEKEQLLVRLLQLLQLNEGAMGNLHRTFSEMGFHKEEDDCVEDRNGCNEDLANGSDSGENGVDSNDQGEGKRDSTAAFVRKMIRDDRKQCADDRQRTQSMKDRIKAERRRIYEEKKTAEESLSSSSSLMQSSPSASSSSSSSLARRAVKILSKVRLHVYEDGKKASSAKLIVVNRSSSSMEDVIELAKRKLNMKAKGKKLYMIIVTGGVRYGVTAAYLKDHIADDTSVILSTSPGRASIDMVSAQDEMSISLMKRLELEASEGLRDGNEDSPRSHDKGGHSNSNNDKEQMDEEQADDEIVVGEQQQMGAAVLDTDAPHDDDTADGNDGDDDDTEDSGGSTEDEDTILPASNAVWAPPRIEGDPSTQHTARKVNASLSAQMKSIQMQKFQDLSNATIQETRHALPIFNHREEIVNLVRDNPVIVLSGDTGSGKTTQLPQYLLEDMISTDKGSEAYIIVTQPRRIAAISVAERVAFERGEKLGKSVGYQVRLHSAMDPDETRLLFCTTGILLRKLQDEHFLERVSHILIDEVHERQIDSDFLMALLKSKLTLFPHLRVVFMSATIQEKQFSDYCHCPIVYVQGRTFPVEIHFLEDVHTFVGKAQRGEQRVDSTGRKSKGQVGGNRKDARKLGNRDGRSCVNGCDDIKAKSPKFDAEIIADLVIRIMQQFTPKKPRYSSLKAPLASSGDGVLVFLSGLQAIRKVEFALRRRGVSTSSNNAKIYILHGLLPADQQKRVFQKTAPGEWKIILSTNIAETSVTVDDVTHVVDTGLFKEIRYDPIANLSSLKEVVVSKASAKQRAGRAGRVRPGHCWRLFSKHFYEGNKASCSSDLSTSPVFPLQYMEEYPVPEIQRVPLEDVVLKTLLFDLGHPETFLSTCLEPPSRQQILTSVMCLADVGAVSASKDSWITQMLQQKERQQDMSNGKPSASFPFTPLTPLGYHLAQMPVDVRLGKMLLYGCMFNCLEPVLTVAAALGGKSIFFRPPNADDKEVYSAHVHFMNSPTSDTSNGGGDKADSRNSSCYSKESRFFSDHLSIVNAFNKWQHVLITRGRKAAKTYCDRYYLSFNALEETRQLRAMFRGYLLKTGFLGDANGPNVSQEAYNDEEVMITDMDDHNDYGSSYDSDIVDSDASFENRVETPQEETFVGGMTPESSHASSNAMLRCIILAGLSPQVVRVCRVPVARKKEAYRRGKERYAEGTIIEMKQADGTEVFIDRASITHRCVGHLLGPDQDQHAHFCGKREAFLTYYKKQSNGGKIYLHDCTVVPPIGVLLFSATGGFTGDLVISKSRKKVEIGGWIRFNIQELHIVLLKQLHAAVNRLLKDRVKDPKMDVSSRKELLVRVVETLLDLN